MVRHWFEVQAKPWMLGKWQSLSIRHVVKEPVVRAVGAISVVFAVIEYARRVHDDTNPHVGMLRLLAGVIGLVLVLTFVVEMLLRLPRWQRGARVGSRIVEWIGRRWWAFAILVFAVLNAIIGDTIFDLFKGTMGSGGARVWRLYLLAVSIVVLFANWPRIWRTLRIQFLTNAPGAETDEEISRHRALIVFVSRPFPVKPAPCPGCPTPALAVPDRIPNVGKSHETAFAHHRDPTSTKGEQLTHIVVIHSADSHKLAMDFIAASQTDGLWIEPRLASKPMDIMSCYWVLNDAITTLLSQHPIPTISRNDIVIETTGGTAPFSTAAGLISSDRNITLEYIEPGKDEEGKPVFDREHVKVKRVTVK